MEDVLIQIKQLVIRGRVAFTLKAHEELFLDDLIEEEVYESLMNAKGVRWKRSRSKYRQQSRERVYIIEAPTFHGIRIYTKGVFRKREEGLIFYVLVSSKRSTDTDRGKGGTHGRTGTG